MSSPNRGLAGTIDNGWVALFSPLSLRYGTRSEFSLDQITKLPREVRALAEVPRFSIIAVRDLAQTVYGSDRNALEQDLGYLERKGVVSLRSINAHRDGSWRQPERVDVVTLTTPGRKIVRQVVNLRRPGTLRRPGKAPRGGTRHASLSHLLKEMDRIECLGGTNPRVMLDFEIKRNVQRAIYAERKRDPELDLDEIALAAMHSGYFLRRSFQSLPPQTEWGTGP